MTTITTRSGKGSPLTNNEVDANFTNLNDDKAELSGADFTGIVSTTAHFSLGNTYNRVADKASGGAFGGGYNLYMDDGTPKHDSLGNLSGYYYTSGGQVRFYASPSSAADTAAIERLRIANNGDITFYDTNGTTASFFYDASAGLTINEAGADRDFRVESDALSHAIYLDAGASNLSFGSSDTPLSLISTTTSGGIGMDLNDEYLVISRNVDSAALYLNKSNGQAGEIIQMRSDGSKIGVVGIKNDDLVIHDAQTGHTGLRFGNGAIVPVDNTGSDTNKAANLGGNTLRFKDAYFAGVDITNDSDRGRLRLWANASLGGEMRIFNANGYGFIGMMENHTLNFYTNNTERLELSSSAAVFNDISADVDFRVESNNQTHAIFVDAGNDTVNINRSSGPASLNVQADSGADGIAIYGRSSDEISQITNYNSTGTGLSQLQTRTTYTELKTLTDVPLYFSPNNALKLTVSTAATIVNENSADHDFRVESNGNTHMLFVNGGSNEVAVGTSNPKSTLHVFSSNSGATPNGNADDLFVENAGNAGITIGSGSSSAGQIRFADSESSGRGIVYYDQSSDLMALYTAGAERFRITAASATFNEDSNDQDFRVESDGNNSMLFVDGGSNRVLIGSSSGLTSTFNVNGNAQFSNGTGDVGSLSIAPSNDRQLISANSPGSYGDYGVTIKSMRTTGGAAYINNIDLTYQEAVFNQESGDVDFRVESSGSSHAIFVDAANDKVGLFTSAPSTALDIRIGGAGTIPATVASGTGAGIFLENNATAEKPYFVSKTHNPGDSTAVGGVKFATSPDGVNYNWAGVLAENSTSGNAGRLRFYTSNANSSGDASTLRMSLLENGRLGISQSSPDYRVHIGDGDNGERVHIQASGGGAVFSGVDSVNNSTNGFRIGHLTGTDRIEAAIGTQQIINWRSSALYFTPGGADTLSTGTDFVTINNGSADIDFRVESNNDTHCLYVDAGNDRVLVGRASAASGNDFVSFDANPGASGQLIQCGRDDTSTKNQVIFTNPNGTVGSIQTAGSATAYNTSSDARLKENIADADDAGALIDAIQVRQFDWIADGEHQRYGMVAQELNTVAPEAVSEGETEEDMMAVDYSKLVPMLVKEIQSLRARVAQLESN